MTISWKVSEIHPVSKILKKLKERTDNGFNDRTGVKTYGSIFKRWDTRPDWRPADLGRIDYEMPKLRI
jgi:hypothetical protein